MQDNEVDLQAATVGLSNPMQVNNGYLRAKNGKGTATSSIKLNETPEVTKATILVRSSSKGFSSSMKLGATTKKGATKVKSLNQLGKRPMQNTGPYTYPSKSKSNLKIIPTLSMQDSSSKVPSLSPCGSPNLGTLKGNLITQIEQPKSQCENPSAFCGQLIEHHPNEATHIRLNPIGAKKRDAQGILDIRPACITPISQPVNAQLKAPASCPMTLAWKINLLFGYNLLSPLILLFIDKCRIYMMQVN